MKNKMLVAGALLAASYSISSQAETGAPTYVSDWWHQSVNVVGSNHTRFGPHLNNDVYLEYEAFAHKDWFDFYGYVDIPNFFGAANSYQQGIWDNGSPLFMEIEPRFSIDKLTGTDLSFGPFKEWYFANNYVYDMGRDHNNRQNTGIWARAPISIPTQNVAGAERLCQIPVGKLRRGERKQLGRLSLQGKIFPAVDYLVGRQPELYRLHQL